MSSGSAARPGATRAGDGQPRLRGGWPAGVECRNHGGDRRRPAPDRRRVRRRARGQCGRGYGGVPPPIGPRPRAVPVPGRARPSAHDRASGTGCDRERARAGLGHGRARRSREHDGAAPVAALSRARPRVPAPLPPGHPARAGAAGARVWRERHPGRRVQRIPVGAADAAGVEPALGWVAAGRPESHSPRRVDRSPHAGCTRRHHGRNLWAMTVKHLGRPLFAVSLVGCGAAGLVLRNVIVYETFPTSSPLHTVTAIVAGVLLVAAGLGLLTRFRSPASVVALIVLALWDLVLNVPGLFTAPRNEDSWLVVGMATMVVVAAWLLTGTTRLRAARTIFGLALIPVGLSHFFFWHITLGLVPPWMPVPSVWVALVGVAHMAAGLGVLSGILPRPAALLEAGQLIVFAVLVWLPRVIAKPSVQFNWTEMLGTLLIGAAAWVMADALADVR